MTEINKESVCRVKKLNINGKWVSGSILIYNTCSCGSVTEHYGCRYSEGINSAAADLLPGDLIKITKGHLEEIKKQDGTTWTCVVVEQFERVKRKSPAHPARLQDGYYECR